MAADGLRLFLFHGSISILQPLILSRSSGKQRKADDVSHRDVITVAH
jgi:hypothetical protein